MKTPRTIAIGDIHGCSAALEALMEAIRPLPADTIVTLGDYIDRGPDSRGVLDRLIALSHHCRPVPLLGNHDQLLLDVRSGKYPIGWLLDMGGTATLDSYGPGYDLGLIPNAHYGFLEGCLPFHETPTHIFVHANYDPSSRWPSSRTGCCSGSRFETCPPGRTSRGRSPSSGTRPRKAARYWTSATWSA